MGSWRGTWAALLFLLAACGDDDGEGGPPADFAGDWTVAITNGANGCSFDPWDEGDTATAIPFVITQSDRNLTGNVQGLAGTYLDVVLGGHTFTGEATGSYAELALFGTRTATEGGCTWSINTTISIELDGDVIQGEIDYTTATNGSPDCGAREGCHTIQSYNGTRPPSAS